MLKKIIGGSISPYKDKQGNLNSTAVSALKKLTLGGIDQWITVRGNNEELPILLFLHGGPGSSQTGVQQKYNTVLEKHYLVVNWDQRGSGKSYSPNIPTESMNINQLLQDAYELVLYLLKRFKKNKVFLMGHSTGAALGLLFAQKYPHLLYAYVGINQPIHREKEEKRSYNFTIQMAQNKNNQKAINQLNNIGFPESGVYRKMDHMVVQRKWLTKFNGVTFKKNAFLININCILSSHLNIKEKLTFMKGFGFSATHLWNELTSLNFFTLVPKIKVPIFFITGKHDRIVFTDLIEEYFHFIKAEEKHLIIFKESGHLACFEEPYKFNQLMINQVLPIYSIRKENKDIK
ncbi:alpha/beta hydrolase [Pseudogracilibacillus sp. SE30717A]|uniref:alpha/beta fold hydrolase n=1 Tax=Pseudogracilibacillus sp. SE30717A TaxID=3098293 RepID=UPI00300E113D